MTLEEAVYAFVENLKRKGAIQEDVTVKDITDFKKKHGVITVKVHLSNGEIADFEVRPPYDA